MGQSFDDLLGEIRACRVCVDHLPLGPRPILRGRPSARLLIISQAPGIRVHQTGLSFNARSGDRLREWLGLDRETFYDEARVAIMPIGFCYPGRDARAVICRRALNARRFGTRGCARALLRSSSPSSSALTLSATTSAARRAAR
jgi:uracil-DNA glycosylase